MHGRGNVRSAAGTLDMIVSKKTYGWPLPRHLGVLVHPGTPAAIWDAERPDTSDLPTAIVRSPNAVIYIKISESPISDEEAIGMTHVIRGAAYRLDPEQL